MFNLFLILVAKLMIKRFDAGLLLLLIDSHDQIDLGEAALSDAEQLMKVWLMVLTEMPYSSTSALRQSKNA